MRDGHLAVDDVMDGTKFLSSCDRGHVNISQLRRASRCALRTEWQQRRHRELRASQLRSSQLATQSMQ